MNKIFLPIIGNGSGNMKISFREGVLGAFEGRKVVPMVFSRGIYVALARNAAATFFLEKREEEYLLFIDLDIRFGKGEVDALMESEEAIVGGLYFLRESGRAHACFTGLRPGLSLKVGGVEEVARLGTGFMRIHRRVFEALAAERPRYVYEGREEIDFFPVGVLGGEWLGEDWYFSELARKAGFRVMLDTRVQLLHEGVCLYPLPHQVAELMEG
jgi:hypothetical protein